MELKLPLHADLSLLGRVASFKIGRLTISQSGKFVVLTL